MDTTPLFHEEALEARKREKEREAEFARLLSDFRSVFATPEGIRVLDHLLDMSGVNGRQYARGEDIYRNTAVADFAREHLLDMALMADEDIYINLIRLRADKLRKGEHDG